MDYEKPVTHFGSLTDLLNELGKYGHTEFWYKETVIGVPGSTGARRLKRIFTRDDREIARWGINGYHWDFLPEYSVPNKDGNCKPPSDAVLIVPELAAEIQLYADAGNVYLS